MAEAIAGVCHIHSTWSDGEFTLAQLRQVLGRDGYRFALMGDHADAMDAEMRAAYARDLAAHSDDSFTFVPGLEVTCERGMHILSLGAIPADVGTDPEAVIRGIAAVGGFSVIAHPKDEHLDWIASFGELPQGLEVWNSKYDGPQAPRPRVFDLYATLRRRAPTLRALYGLDLHWKVQARPLSLRLRSNRADAESILAALSRGDYAGLHGGRVLPADGDVPAAWLDEWAPISAEYLARRRRLKTLSKQMGSPGRFLPAPLKNFLRRFF